MRTRILIRVIGSCVFLLMAAGFVPSEGATGVSQDPEKTLIFERFHADIQVFVDGSIEVVEELRVQFVGSWNGIYRRIPVDYETPSGFSYSLRLDFLGATDESGSALRTEVSRSGRYRKLKIWVPGAEDVVRTIRLRYRVPNGLRFFEEHDELYWNVTGTEWDYPILAASALVTLPSATTDRRANAFRGAYGSETNAAQGISTESGFLFETVEPLRLREGLTVAVAWAPGVVHRPTVAEKVFFFLRSNILFGMPLVSFFGMFFSWRRWGKDPERLAIAPAYEAPPGLRPAEVGTLIDDKVDMRDVTASIVDLAVRGFLRIEEVEDSAFFGLIDKTDYRFVLLRPLGGHGEELHLYEQRLLLGMFTEGAEPGHTTLMSDLENRFYKELSDIKNGVFARLLEIGMYRRRPDHTKAAWITGGLVGVAVAIGGGVALAASTMVNPGPVVLAGLLTAIPVVGFGVVMSKRTVAGARAVEQIMGLREFMDRVDGDQYRRMITSPEMFESLLPYAMALGVESRWAKAFDGIYKTAPDWYVGHHPGVFHPHIFAHQLSAMTTRASSAMVSQPRSSGGSGFGGGGGGGFSGGGFGGGGGGGF